MNGLQTLLVLGLLIGPLPMNTFAHPFHTPSPTSLLFARGSPSLSSNGHHTPTTSTTPLAIDDPKDNFPDLFDPPSRHHDTGPHVLPTAVIVLFPAIVGFSIMGGLWLCFARRKSAGNETGRVGNSVNGQMESLDNPTRQEGQSRPQMQLQRLQPGREVSEDDEAPPPYSREPP